MPARALSTWSGHQRGGWHAAAHELAVLVVVELEYCRQQFFIRVRRTPLFQDIYHDWTVAMAWGGAESLKGWYVDDNDKVAQINRRAQAFRRRVRRFAKRRGFGKQVGGSSYAEDVYYAAVATLVDDGAVSMWVRRRDVHGGPMAQAAEWGFASGSDMYWIARPSNLFPEPTALRKPPHSSPKRLRSSVDSRHLVVVVHVPSLQRFCATPCHCHSPVVIDVLGQGCPSRTDEELLPAILQLHHHYLSVTRKTPELDS